MKLKAVMLILLIGTLFMLTGCGERVSINSGEVGKQLTDDGLEDIIWGPGSFRMDMCLWGGCPKLIRLETAVAAQEISVDQIFLPESNVALNDAETFTKAFLETYQS